MSVLRYCCFRWLVYDRALVFEPSRPLACIMMLVWLILFVELCCDMFPWVPDLDRTHLRAWLVYDWIGGVTIYHLWLQCLHTFLGVISDSKTESMRDFFLCYPAILTNTIVPQPGLSSILQNQLGVALDALTISPFLVIDDKLVEVFNGEYNMWNCKE